MTPTPPATARSEAFIEAQVAAGQAPDVAEELERRIHLIDTEERDDESRKPMSGGELATYLGVTVALVALGILVVVL